MSIELTHDSVMGLAPDVASQKAAAKLSTLNKWATLGKSPIAVWGECRGSGSKPYQARVDLTEIAFKCSCPSRKFPCKHGLALLFVYVSDNEGFIEADAPDWVSEWLDGRQKRQQKKANPEKKPIDVKQQKKRIVQRENRIQAGIEELQIWLEDLIRHGLAQAQSKPFSFWEQMAARLVDQQASGLANRVRTLSTVCASGDGWLERLLKKISALQLLIEANHNLSQLSPDLQQEVRSLTGWSQKKDDTLQGEIKTGQWRVLGQRIEELEQVTRQKIWLQNLNGEFNYILNFIHPMSPQGLDLTWLTGSQLELELALYAGVRPQRVIEKQRLNSHPMTEPQGQATIAEALTVYKQYQQQNPWLTKLPLVLHQVLMCYEDESLWVQDAEGDRLPLHPHVQHWEWLAVSGGLPVTLVTEWDEQNLYPLGLWSQQHYLTVVEARE